MNPRLIDRLPLLGTAECTWETTSIVAHMAGDYQWHEEAAPLWILLAGSVSKFPNVGMEFHKLDTDQVSSLVTEWVARSTAFKQESRVMPAIIHWHRAALNFDLRSALHLDVDTAMTIPWNEAWDYISGILRSHTSHLFSEMNGDKYFPAESERAAWDIAELNLNSKRSKGSPPIRLPRPWAGVAPTYREASQVVDSAREARLAKLAALF